MEKVIKGCLQHTAEFTVLSQGCWQDISLTFWPSRSHHRNDFAADNGMTKKAN
jgi:hypothetical protein